MWICGSLARCPHEEFVLRQMEDHLLVRPGRPRNPHNPAEQGRWPHKMPSSTSTQRKLLGPNAGPRVIAAHSLQTC